jgi:membrane-associated protein
MARFVPIVRTFITAMAGVGRMNTKKFFTYSAIGGVLWATGIILLGFFLGRVEFVKDNIEPMLLLIVLISVIPIIIEVIKARREKKHVTQQVADDATEVIDRVT